MTSAGTVAAPAPAGRRDRAVPVWLSLLALALGGFGIGTTEFVTLNHSALNLGNALGAWLGGLVIAAGFGYTSPALVGAALAAGGLVVISVSLLLERRAGETAVPATA